IFRLASRIGLGRVLRSCQIAQSINASLSLGLTGFEMRIILTLFCIVSALACSSVSAVLVTPGNMNGWHIYTTHDTGALGPGSGTGNFVTGPATPPLGTGSGHLQTPSGG